MIDYHVRATKLASALQALPKLFVNITQPQTNILFFEVAGEKGKEFVSEMRKRDVLMGSYGTSSHEQSLILISAMRIRVK